MECFGAMVPDLNRKLAMQNHNDDVSRTQPAQEVKTYLDDRSPCEDCWMGEYKETGYRYCLNSKCPSKPGAGN
jgi:hypothetical protein